MLFGCVCVCFKTFLLLPPRNLALFCPYFIFFARISSLLPLFHQKNIEFTYNLHKLCRNIAMLCQCYVYVTPNITSRLIFLEPENNGIFWNHFSRNRKINFSVGNIACCLSFYRFIRVRAQ